MTPSAIDTNVPIMANGSDDLDCQEACIAALEEVEQGSRIVLLDDLGEILAEYRTHLSPSGQPGVGDRFYQLVLQRQGNPSFTEAVTLRKAGTAYLDWPPASTLAAFDHSDRKFAIVAMLRKGVVLNATDTDWSQFSTPLSQAGISVVELCPHVLQKIVTT